MILNQYGKPLSGSPLFPPEALAALQQSMLASIKHDMEFMADIRGRSLVDPRGNPVGNGLKIGSTIQVRLPYRFTETGEAEHKK